jgi:zinc transporter, ZIP family
MNNPQLLTMTIPAVVATVGGVIAALWRPSHQFRSLVQHFAAGVILAALAVELLPDIANEHATPGVIIGSFAMGSLFMYGLKLWTMRLEHRAAAATTTVAPALGMGLLMATFVDVATDGFIIGAGFAANGEAGTILALGLSVELLFLGMALASETVKGWRVVGLSTGLGLTVLLFAVMGSVLLGGASQQLIGGVLAFSAAALLYLVTEELLIEAHTVEEKPISTLVLFAGFLVFWSIQLLAG